MPIFERTDLGENTFQLKVSLLPEDYYPKFEKELKSFRKDAVLKGFRKGQAPMSYVKKLYGKDVYPKLVLDQLMEQLDVYIKENKIQLIGQPLAAEGKEPEISFDFTKKDQNQTFYYDIGYIGEFEVAGMDGSIKLEQLVVSDLDALAEVDLENARRRGGEQVSVDDKIQEKDMLTIEAVEVDEDNAPVDGGYTTTLTLYVDSVKNEEVRAMLLDSSKDDIIFFNGREMEDFKTEQMYRKYFLSIPEDDERTITDMFRGEIKDIKRIAISELNEEFFKNFGEDVTDKAGAIEKIKGGIDTYYRQQTHNVVRRNARLALIEANPLPIPENLLKRWIKTTKEGTTDEQIEEVSDVLFEDLRWSLIQQKLESGFDLFASDEEIAAVARQQIMGYFQGQAMPDDVIGPLVENITKDPKSRTQMARQVENNKLYMEILNKMVITDKPMPSEQLHTEMEAISKDAEAFNQKMDKLNGLLS